MSQPLKPYPEYKGSGLPWFGRVPAHWRLDRLGAILEERGEVNRDGRVTQVLSVLRDRGVIPYEQKGNIGNKRSEDITRYRIVRPDDIVVNCMNVIIGSVGLSRYTGCLSPVYYVLRTRNQRDSPEYFDRVFAMEPFQRSLTRLGNGILPHRMRIPMEKLKCERLPRPPVEEQRAIASFLDHYDRLTRRYIRAQRRLIELLEEQKQALIQRVVTRGLYPGVQLKDSGVEWLGKIPAHWKSTPLKYLACRIQNGTTPPTSNRSYYEEGSVPWYGPSSIGDAVEIGEPVRLLNSIALADGKARRIRGPALLVVVIGTVGKTALLQHEGSCNQQVTSLELRTDHLEPLFVAYQFRLAESCLQAAASSATIPIIDGGKLARTPVALPPLDEQKAIIHSLEGLLQPLQDAVSHAERQVDLILEYRTRLIADVVTGKLDVRSVPLPDLKQHEQPDSSANSEGDSLH